MTNQSFTRLIASGMGLKYRLNVLLIVPVHEKEAK
jgi:hypothetical protein